jgi:hypothetical protein
MRLAIVKDGLQARLFLLVSAENLALPQPALRMKSGASNR